MSRVVPVSNSLTVYPSSYVPNTEDGAWYSIAGTSNAYKAYDSTNTNYCTIGLTRGTAGAETYAYFKFNTSSIPADATIDSISCIARVYISNTSAANVASRGGKMCSGTTEKTAAITLSTSAQNRTFTMGTWTREELNDIRLKLYATRGTSNLSTAYNIRLYGATLTIEYTYDTIYYGVSGTSSIAGVTISTSEADYLEGSTVSVTISGASGKSLSVLDNGVDVSNEIVASGSDYVYTINNISADHSITVDEAQQQGQTIFVKQNGVWVSVDSIYVKQSGVWKEVETLSIKQNGSWIN